MCHCALTVVGAAKGAGCDCCTYKTVTQHFSFLMLRELNDMKSGQSHRAGGSKALPDSDCTQTKLMVTRHKSHKLQNRTYDNRWFSVRVPARGNRADWVFCGERVGEDDVHLAHLDRNG